MSEIQEQKRRRAWPKPRCQHCGSQIEHVEDAHFTRSQMTHRLIARHVLCFAGSGSDVEQSDGDEQSEQLLSKSESKRIKAQMSEPKDTAVNEKS